MRRVAASRAPVTTLTSAAALELTDWRRRVAGLYTAARTDHDPERARWAAPGTGPAVPDESPEARSRQAPAPPAVPSLDYDLAVRSHMRLLPAPGPRQRPVSTGADQTTTLRLIGQVTFPAPLHVTVDAGWLRRYGGGLFLP